MSSVKSRGLGRGLEALIPQLGRDGKLPEMVPVDLIRPSSLQVRAHFDTEKLRELADSIRAQGVIQPVLLRKVDGGYELIAGERRWRAARIAGLSQIPALVHHDTEPETQLVLGLIENLQRSDLDAIEEARGLKLLTEEYGLTHEEAALRIGKSRIAVTQSLRLLQATPVVRSAVVSGSISAGHARALVALATDEAQDHGLKVVLSRRLSVRQTESWVRGYQQPRVRRRLGAAELGRLRLEMEAALGVAVSINGGLSRGRLTLHYNSRQELQALFDRLTG